MAKIILPSANSVAESVESANVANSVVLGTTTGLVKGSNEDRVGLQHMSASTRVCMADGHWGDEAAQMIVDAWLDGEPFPVNTVEAIQRVGKVESMLYRKFGKKTMDPERDFTSEASFICIEAKDKSLKVVSYGDCRMIVVRHKKVTYQHQTFETWLGAFSYLGLRGRMPIGDVVTFTVLDLEPEDIVAVFTDGVDQCKYEENTISNRDIAALVDPVSLSESFKAIIDLVIQNGAEDNASLALLRL